MEHNWHLFQIVYCSALTLDLSQSHSYMATRIETSKTTIRMEVQHQTTESLGRSQLASIGPFLGTAQRERQERRFATRRVTIRDGCIQRLRTRQETHWGDYKQKRKCLSARIPWRFVHRISRFFRLFSVFAAGTMGCLCKTKTTPSDWWGDGCMVGIFWALRQMVHYRPWFEGCACVCVYVCVIMGTKQAWGLGRRQNVDSGCRLMYRKEKRIQSERPWLARSIPSGRI